MAVELGILHIDVLHRRPPLARHQMVLGCVDRDPVQPGIEGTLAAEALERAKGLDEGFLRDVGGIAVTDQSRAQLDDLVLVLAHQQIKGARIPLLGTQHQLFVEFLFAHAHGAFTTAVSSGLDV